MTYGSKKDGWLFGFVWGVVPGLPAVGLLCALAPFGNPAPVWSLDRLRVEYPKGGAPRVPFISPEEKLGFMRDLAGAAPGLELGGDRVVRNVKIPAGRAFKREFPTRAERGRRRIFVKRAGRTF